MVALPKQQREELHALFTLLLSTGLRPSEAIALKWMDLAGGSCYVMRTLAKVEGCGVFSEPQTKSSCRVVLIPVSLAWSLASQRQTSEIVFTNNDGDPVRIYDLRHTCATLLLLAGEHPKKVAERLGHAGISLTLNTYSHVLPGMQREGAEKLERMLFEPVSNEPSFLNN